MSITGPATVDWAGLAAARPELAAAGKRRLVGDDGVAMALLATTGVDGPRMAPVCPVFAGSGLYLIAAASTPKVRDLMAAPAFTLHAFLGPGDEEFQLSGRAGLVASSGERAAVHTAVAFAGFDRTDPIFHLRLRRVLSVCWERVGEPDTRAVRERWMAAPV